MNNEELKQVVPKIKVRARNSKKDKILNEYIQIQYLKKNKNMKFFPK